MSFYDFASLCFAGLLLLLVYSDRARYWAAQTIWFIWDDWLETWDKIIWPIALLFLRQPKDSGEE